MSKLERWRMVKYFDMKEKIINDETGATNIIEIAFIIVAVIAIVGIFRGGLEEIVNGLLGKIKDGLGL